MANGNKSRITVKGVHYSTGRMVRVEITDGLISEISETNEEVNHLSAQYISPGLIDNQINGYSNVDFSGNDLSGEAVSNSARAVWKDGVTTFFPTLITNSHENLIRNFAVLNEALEKDDMLAGSVPGFHLEGPYISPDEGYRGCHPVHYIRKPLWEEFLVYQKAAGGKIIQLTIAPEAEGAMDFIRLCTKNGIVTAMGHTNSTREQIAEAVGNGVRLSTHLGNGCANFIHRHNNPIWPQLAEERLTSTLIADGFHLLPEELKVFFKVKGFKNIILTSDVMYLAGMAPGKYTFLESEVILTEEGMLRNIALNCLAGASFPLKTGVGNMMKFTGCSLANAIDMASGNVAGMYGLNDRGTLAVGKRGDLILFALENHHMKISKTYLNGQLVFGD